MFDLPENPQFDRFIRDWAFLKVRFRWGMAVNWPLQRRFYGDYIESPQERRFWHLFWLYRSQQAGSVERDVWSMTGREKRIQREWNGSEISMEGAELHGGGHKYLAFVAQHRQHACDVRAGASSRRYHCVTQFREKKDRWTSTDATFLET